MEGFKSTAPVDHSMTRKVWKYMDGEEQSEGTKWEVFSINCPRGDASVGALQRKFLDVLQVSNYSEEEILQGKSY